MSLVTWRYVWMTTPLHRSHRTSPALPRPPALDEAVSTHGLQPIESGAGPVYHRKFRIDIVDAQSDAAALMRAVKDDWGRFMPREVVRVRSSGANGPSGLELGVDLVVDMPGPWNGPVRIVSVGSTHVGLATLRGHLEAGQIEFRARDHAPGEVTFEIEVWARPATPLVRLLYQRLRLAKEIQLNMWVRFCVAAARRIDGRVSSGVHIDTVECAAA
ncbi:DUF1990 family protein [Nocardioides sp. YIM 152315]|uniref:DUF1990 family protein n=1 Tax=Nocardioides sp. YIM 152315 TaxID=3031760 RepID=UPI0023DA4ACC|nr:DUF1990 family protein [Nocardioides sp. YIM 152315]MDF1606078.1 DUF1990 family protein [Nocardioides sp. YIM 152315]